jgi:hypothetical protein
MDLVGTKDLSFPNVVGVFSYITVESWGALQPVAVRFSTEAFSVAPHLFEAVTSVADDEIVSSDAHVHHLLYKPSHLAPDDCRSNKLPRSRHSVVTSANAYTPTYHTA